MNLSTTYLGMELEHPVMAGAGPLADDLDTVKKLEDAGAAAIVMRSLFEEQITMEQMSALRHTESHNESHAEATSYLPDTDVFALGTEEYLEQLRKIRETVKIPVIASLNGSTSGGWTEYAKKMEQAGASALELNLYYLATDLNVIGDVVEARVLDVVERVKAATSLPVAVKLSPFFSSIANLAKRLDYAGADALVLFNRFYQPDIDLEALEVAPRLNLSGPSELLLRLRWTAILSGRLKASLAITGGVHSTEDVVKSVMVGAHAVQVVSALLEKGPEYVKTLVDGLRSWLEEHEYESLKQAQGSMNLYRSPDPSAYERANYMRILQSWKG